MVARTSPTILSALVSVTWLWIPVQQVYAAAHANADQLSAVIQKAVDDPRRPDKDKERDGNRKPSDVIAFAGTKPGDVIADVSSSGGYYTRILSEVVGAEGKVYAFNATEFASFLGDTNPADVLAEEYDNVISLMASFNSPEFPEPLDAAYIIINYHDVLWDRVGADVNAMNRALFDALKPGGIYLIVDHHAEAGSGIRDVGTLHRIDAATVIEGVTAAGFELVSESDVLANPDDDLTKSVFDSSVRGRTDRFIYKFRRPE